MKDKFWRRELEFHRRTRLFVAGMGVLFSVIYTVTDFCSVQR